jgi:hypothetical protein
MSLALSADAITGALRRELGNQRAWVALRLNHVQLRGSMLMGCEYQVHAAVQQEQDDAEKWLTK